MQALFSDGGKRGLRKDKYDNLGAFVFRSAVL